MKTPTKLTHLGRDARKQEGFVNPPVYRGSTVLFDSLEALTHPAPDAYTYGRHSNPTQKALTDLMCELEQGQMCKLAPSGLAAISCALLAFAGAGDHILVSDSVYYPTRAFCDSTLKSLGVKTTYYDPLIGAGIKALITPVTRLIFTESPGTHTFDIQDLTAITEAAAAHDIVVLMDNTWATPLFLTPLSKGVDVSIHSGTKYITGHADALIGLITTNGRAAERLQRCHRSLGLCAGSEEVYAALKGLRTLDVRLQRHQLSALRLATWLETRPEVQQVLHPALSSFRGHQLWKRDFSGSSGLFSIELKPCRQDALARFLDGLQLFGMGWSWGGYESLIVPVDLRAARTVTSPGFSGPLLRLHVGLEDVADLQADLTAAFDRLQEGAG